MTRVWPVTTLSVRGASRTLRSHSSKPGYQSVIGAGSGERAEAVDVFYRPRQVAVLNQVTQRLYAVAEEHVVGVLHPLRPLDEIKPRCAEHSNHVVAQDPSGTVGVTAPDEFLDAPQPSLQRVDHVSVAGLLDRIALGGFVLGAVGGEHLRGRNTGLDQGAGVELPLDDVDLLGVGLKHALQIPKRSLEPVPGNEMLLRKRARLPAIARAGWGSSTF